MNLSTLIILVILVLLTGAIVRVMIKDKKSGKGCGGCAGGCGGCAGSSMCHGSHEKAGKGVWCLQGLRLKAVLNNVLGIKRGV